MTQSRLKAKFYERFDTCELAQKLLGKLLVRWQDGVRLSGIIVETEAYLPSGDTASHSHRGPTPRNTAMFMQPGTLYVYSIHTRYCMNIVSESQGIGAAVLVRALEPWEGIEQMRENRQAHHDRDLTSGPGRLCQALQVDRTLDKSNLLTSDAIWLEDSPAEVRHRDWTFHASPRIGISSAQDALLRFFIDGHHCVSGLARLHRQKRHWTFGNATKRG